MFSKFRTHAATRALIGVLLAGATLGLGFGAACIAGQPTADQLRAQALVRAAQAGYEAAHAVAPPTGQASAPLQAAKIAAPRPGSAAGAHGLDCLAAAIYYEARGESLAGQAAVAQVVLNRTRHGAYPRNICAVVYQGAIDGDCQFSFACNGAMRGRREPRAWVAAHKIAARALAGYVMTAVGEATCFHAAHGASAAQTDRGLRLGGHIFYATFAPRRLARTQVSAADNSSAPVAGATAKSAS